MKSARLIGTILCVMLLASLACNAPSVPVLTRAEPTATPRPSRTSRPTFTPTPTETPTPVATATPTKTNTPVATNTPVPTDTPVPPPPTPTNTRRPPPPPTATFTAAPPAPPTNTPAPVFQFSVSLGDTKNSNNCGLTAINGQVQDRGGNPLAGVTMHVSADGWPGANVTSSNGYAEANAPTRTNAQVTLSNYPKKGKWYVSVIDDSGNRLSNELAVFTDDVTDEKDCSVATFRGGGVQVVPVVIKQN